MSSNNIEGVYDYLNAQGNYLYSVIRYKGKKFSQGIRRADGSYDFNVPAELRVPYNLPNVIKAIRNGETIFFCEGEKDCHTLEKLGLTATTTGGATSWKDHFAEWFEGAKIVILPDNDEPGRNYAQMVANDLMGIAKSIRILEIPGLPDKGDVTDWIEQGNSKEDLLTLVINSNEYQPEQKEQVNKVFEDILKDSGNAKLLQVYCQDSIIYCHDAPKCSSWFIWSGKHWKVDKKQLMYQKAEKAIDLLYKPFRQLPIQDQGKLITHIKTSKNTGKIKSMLEYATSLPAISTLQNELDTDDFLLNCNNGTLNLKTKKLQEHSKTDLITKLVRYDYNPNAKCPLWEQSLKHIFLDDMDLIKWFQKYLGYSITGSTSEQCFCLLYGDGANGKSTVLNIINDIFSDYHARVQTETLMDTERKGSNASPDIARLAGTRIVTAVESKQSRALAEGLIKQLTGDDEITARHLNRENFEFKPKFKLFLAVNHLPTIKGQDFGIWRRIKEVPFNARFEGKNDDKQLKYKLKLEYEGILNWIVEGCYLWQNEGLGTCQTIQETTNRYKCDQDNLSDFKFDCCLIGNNFTIGSSKLYEAYRDYETTRGNMRTMSQKNFANYLNEGGFKTKHNRDGNYFIGITLKLSVNVNDVKGNTCFQNLHENQFKKKISDNAFNPSQASQDDESLLALSAAKAMSGHR